MTILAVALSAVCVVLVGLFAWGQRDTVLPSRARSTVVVTLKSGTSFRGVLWESDAACLVLRRAELLERTGEATAVDGEVLLLRPEVDFVQKP